ncbi:carboxyvinyl-carboxyphosphonate phosphorylmutase [Elioraea sp. Yellowstone]|uniref:isocitrate lyase/PEP mutase family protein n=1 Tax=Elioraea sp. Yellowstone TaxID=2592070 RepID=UPI00114FE004|nr:isocitrate lyase/phosphoenolpyruvate mutase family protein [Elioraea sp. Yellowstone]TQF82792.1 carboxyvinyl-carboxyphosphonate phosphorylmutase [Elioraea sp. Yellowstone]
MDLRQRLAEPRIVLAPGVCDALTAAIAAAAGFEALYVSGAAIAYTRLGRPDLGLVAMTEVADHVARIADRVDVPLIVDADTGYGNALNVQRTVRALERAGAAMIQLEDQTFPKRCGHLDGKAVIPAAEMVGKIRAAADARQNAATLILARTDAAAIEGLDAALDRARAYAEAGADALFVEAPRTRADLARVTAALGTLRPLLANMVEGGKTPVLSAPELEAIGFRIVIFPGGIVRALARTAREFYASLAATGTTEPFRDRMLDLAGLNDLIGTPAMLALGKRYDA